MDQDFDQPGHEELATDIGHLGDSGWVDGSQPEENSDFLERKCYRDQFQGTYWSLTRLQVWKERTFNGRTLILCHDGRCDVPDGTSGIDHQERGDPDNPPPSSDSASSLSSADSGGGGYETASYDAGGYQDGQVSEDGYYRFDAASGQWVANTRPTPTCRPVGGVARP